jgi:putative flippase GtrA
MSVMMGSGEPLAKPVPASARKPFCSALPLSAKLLRLAPPGQFTRYMIVGLWNVGFGYAAYAFFTAIVSPHIPHGYLAGSLLASLVSITVAFFWYKWFVFKTRGNYWREWIRAVSVYSTVVALGLILLPPTVFLVTQVTGNPKSAPYIAGALLTVLNAGICFFGHKKISFRVA